MNTRGGFRRTEGEPLAGSRWICLLAVLLLCAACGWRSDAERLARLGGCACLLLLHGALFWGREPGAVGMS